MEVKIYVENSDYSRERKGGWVELPQSLQDIKHKLGFDESDEELQITDYEAPFKISPYDSIEKLNEFIDKFVNIPIYITDHIDELIENFFSDVDELVDNWEGLTFLPDVTTDRALGDALVDLEMIDVPEHLINYVDEEAIGRDFRLEQNVLVTDDGTFYY